MRVSRYSEWAYDLTSTAGYLWVSTAAHTPKIVRVEKDLHDALMRSVLFGAEVILNRQSSREPAITQLRQAGVLVNDNPDPADFIEQNYQAATNSRTLRRVILPSARYPHACGKGSFGAYCGQVHSKNKLQAADGE